MSKKKGGDVAEKIREIKQRQTNWFRQRAVSQERSEPKTGNPAGARKNSPTVSPALPPEKLSKKPATSQRNSNLRKTYNKPSQESSQPVNFHRWRENRQSQKEEPSPNHDDIDPRDSLASGTLSVASSARNISPSGSARDSVATLQDTATPISPEMFDTLADKIVNRVKQELSLKQVGGDHADNESQLTKAPQMNNQVDSDCDELGNELNRSGYGLDSHRCHKCSQVMSSSSHTPMLVIPCGHTYCAACVRNRSHCPGCECSIQSVTGNLMLQQIIQEYKRSRESRTDSRAGKKREKYSTEDRTEQLRNLQMRCEVLEQETEEIALNVRKIDQQVDSEQQQISSIAKAEERIHMDIKNLEQQLADLQQHRDDYKVRCEELDSKKRRENDRLDMVHRTLRDLRSQIAQISFEG